MVCLSGLTFVTVKVRGCARGAMKRSRNESHAERSVSKKTEKLKKEAKEMTQELELLDQRYKKIRKNAREEAEERKAEFLRQAAALRRRVDESATELQKTKDAIARDEPELNELRMRLADLNEQHRERKEILESDKAARLRALSEEIERLEAD